MTDHRIESPADAMQPEHVDPAWFRAPSRLERLIAAGLFIGFGVFFVALFVVQRGWWFRWVILGIGVISFARGIRHALGGSNLASAENHSEAR
jgi:hypothetical protein